MRAGHTYRCPRCGEQFACSVTCFRCDILPVDENGNRPPPTFTRESMARGGSPSGVGEADLFFRLVAVGGHSLQALALGVKELNARRRAARAFRRPLSRVADVSDSPAHIRGVVEVLEPVRHPDAGEVGVYLLRRRDHGVLETRLACGKLLVRDETGVALLDDDFFSLLPPLGQHPLAHSELDIIVRAGDTLEVIGPAQRRTVPELPLADEGGYRSAPSALVFDGSTSEPLSLRPLPP